jgi:hypothetical protein
MSLPPELPSDYVAPTAEVIARLRHLYGKAVRTGGPIPHSRVDAAERALGVTFPADYRRFVEEHGWLVAGDKGQIVIFGLATGPAPVPEGRVSVDVVTATRALAAVVAERGIDVGDAAPLVPVYAAASDFPAHSVHVIDRHGELRWFLVEAGDLEESLGFSFAAFLADQTAELQYHADHADRMLYAPADLGAEREDEAEEAEPRSLPDRELYVISPELLHVFRSPRICALVFESDDARKEIRGWCDDAKEEDWNVTERAALDDLHTLVTAGAPLLGPPVRLEEHVGELIFQACRLSPEAAIATGSSIARALCGDRGLAETIGGHVFAVDPSGATDLARELPALVELANTETDHPHWVMPEDLCRLTDPLSNAYERAAALGHAVVLRYELGR